VFNQNMSIIKTSEANLAKDAKDKVSLVNLVKMWIPLIVLIVGFIVLVIGAGLMFRARKVTAKAS
jgi:hypothetical protein